MNPGTTGYVESLRRIRAGMLALVALVVTALLVGARLAFARGASAAVGSGVVVIDTNLGYQGGQAAGTGMVLTSSGEVLTNNHVIAGATTIRVVVPATGRSYATRVVGYDVAADVAVLQLRGASNLATVSTSSAKLSVGQPITAVGNAGGTGRLVSVDGTITGLRKTITAGDESGRSERLSGLIEIDAAVQPGDSGGPLLDGNGRVIGMDTAASAGFGFGFRTTSTSDAYAIPIGRALPLAKQIEAGRSSAAVHVGPTAFLGVEVESVSDAYRYGDSGVSGALIGGVVPGGPAASAGLVPGDVITAIGGRTVSSPASITAFVLARKPGARVAVGYVDQYGSRHTVSVTLGSGPPQ